MSIKLIACGVFKTDIEKLRSQKEGREDLDIVYLEGGLHAEPHRLRESLQNEIDSSQEYEKIVLLYGLCGTGSAGLKAGRVPIAIPKVHDCIALFLGSDAAYAEQFRRIPGTYYISAGWFEEQVQPKGRPEEKPKTDPIRLSKADTAPEVLSQRYGKENAEAILEFTHSWKRNYKRAVFIDTGAGDQERYRSYVDSMGSEFGWQTETIRGSSRLIERALDATEEDDEILIIHPGQVSYFDAAAGKLAAADPESIGDNYSEERRIRTIPGKSGRPGPERRYGLGIDAGGTYTDAALFDLKESRVLAKAKALTTPWDYTEGIGRALAQLPSQEISKTEIVSVSTTLATNAIVEDNRQSVGLLLMPLGGELPAGIDHEPVKIIAGRMSIAGEELEAVDPEEIRRTAQRMQKQGVRAFAVSGYGGSVNPRHEQEIAAILTKETGLMVCTGHELSGQLDFTVRASTAVLNAGIIPHLETFFHAIESCLAGLGIEAPVLFVRGDGFLMNASFAMEHPIETALSGPAASIAGARYLSGLSEATVIDVGGTTSDIGHISGGAVEADPNGAMIGIHRTHVQAVDMVTLGLGGDSAIIFERGELHLGPKRVTPLCRLRTEELPLLSALTTEIDSLADSTRPAQIFRYTGKLPPFEMNRSEAAALEVLKTGPRSLLALADEAGLGHWRFVKLERLLSVRSIEVLGLTPTDLLHYEKRLFLGERSIAVVGIELIAQASSISSEELIRRIWKLADRQLASGVIAKLLGLPLDDPALPLLVGGGSERATIELRPKAPILGLGAAAPYLLKGIESILGCKAEYPENGDVANALGAITSEVRGSAAGSILPAADGFRLTGADETIYTDLLSAQLKLEERLIDEARERAKAAGTSASAVELATWDRIGRTGKGEVILLERCVEAVVRGLPDLA